MNLLGLLRIGPKGMGTPSASEQERPSYAGAPSITNPLYTVARHLAEPEGKAISIEPRHDCGYEKPISNSHISDLVRLAVNEFFGDQGYTEGEWQDGLNFFDDLEFKPEDLSSLVFGISDKLEVDILDRSKPTSLIGKAGALGRGLIGYPKDGVAIIYQNPTVGQLVDYLAKALDVKD